MMRKPIVLSIFVSLLLFNNSFGNWQDTKETKTILIFLGLVPSQPAYRPLLAGITTKLTEEFGDGYILHTEYLETENYLKDNYPKERFDIYNEKYNDIELDLLICIGRNAISTIKKNASTYLLSLPTISLDFDFSDYGIVTDLRLNNHTALIAWKLNIDKTITTSLSLFPSTSSIYFIGGTTDWDRFLMMIAKKASKNINKDIQINFISDISMDNVLQRVHSLPEGSIIFVPSFNTDSKKVTYYNPESVKLISLRAKAPVFAYSDMGFGDGSVGGYILSFRKTGLNAGDIAVKILNGANPNSFILTEKDYYEFIFDWRQLKRWNIADSDLIPEESTILFKEVNFIDEYKWIFGAVLLFLVLQSILIANLFRLNRKQKLMTKKVIETENRYREFLQEDRSLRLGQLAASLSHELNQPLTAILSNAQAGINFINSNEATPELLKQIFQKIVENDKRGASILSSIRGMMKLESRQKEKTDINSLVNEVAAVYKNEASLYGIELNVKLSDEPVYIFADGIQIQQVLLNLFLNALQSMQRANSEHNAIDISQTTNNGEVVISVRDYGNGIDESIKEKLFKPFVTLKKEGMGIGLSICRSIIEDHEGKIWAENMTDGGAKFSFSLKIFEDGQD
jgi:signal transduction histidine kinase